MTMNGHQPLGDSATAPLHTLALGLEPFDALRDTRVLQPIHVDIEGPRVGWARPLRDSRPFFHVSHLGSSRPVIARHHSGLHALLDHPSLEEVVDIRLYERHRFYVPRRLRVPLWQADPVDGEPFSRWRSPVMFPGAAHAITERATGLRGGVLRGGEPMPWSRVIATLPGSGEVVGRAHGDDRGEFLLVLSPNAAPEAELRTTLSVDVTILGPAVAPVPAPPEAVQDPLWDLPIEEITHKLDGDPVTGGQAIPAGYVPGVVQSIEFELGRIISVQGFTFAP